MQSFSCPILRYLEHDLSSPLYEAEHHYLVANAPDPCCIGFYDPLDFLLASIHYLPRRPT